MARKKREIPWIEKRGDTYYAFWYNAALRVTEKCSLRTKDPVEAQDRFAAFLTEGKALFVKGAAGLTVTDILDAYYEEHVRPNVINKKNAEINNRHLKNYFADRQINELGVPDGLNYLESRVNDGIMLSTASKELQQLRAACNHAVKWKRLVAADVPVFEFPLTPASKGVWLFKDELHQLMEASKSVQCEFMPLRAYCFINLAYYTAARRESIEKLEWDRVDMKHRRIALSKPGEKETKKRRPTIAMDPRLIPIFQHLHKHRIDNYVLGRGTPMYCAFQSAAKQAGLLTLPTRDARPTAQLTPHMLRHSRATHLLQAGKDPYMVASLLGDTVNTVLNVYGHHCSDHQEALFDSADLLENSGSESGSLRDTGRYNLSDIVA